MGLDYMKFSLCERCRLGWKLFSAFFALRWKKVLSKDVRVIKRHQKDFSAVLSGTCAPKALALQMRSSAKNLFVKRPAKRAFFDRLINFASALTMVQGRIIFYTKMQGGV